MHQLAQCCWIFLKFRPIFLHHLAGKPSHLHHTELENKVPNNLEVIGPTLRVFSCEVRGGLSVRMTCHRICIGMVLRQCVCDNAALTRQILRISIHILPSCNCRVFPLKEGKIEICKLVAEFYLGTTCVTPDPKGGQGVRTHP